MKVELAGHYTIGRLVRTSLPIIVMLIVTSIYSVVDGLFVSVFAGNTEFAALNIIWPVLALIGAVGLMIGTGGSALVSKLLGEQNKEKAYSVFTLLVQVAIVSGLIFSILLFAFMRPIVILLGAEGEMVGYAVTYGRIVVLSMPAFILQMAFQSFFMVAEKPQLGTIMSIMSGIVNIVLDFLLIIIFGLGLNGAAIGTAVAMAVGGIFPVIYFASGRHSSNLRFVRISGIDWSSLFKSCTNGMSEYVGNVALNVVSIGYNYQLMKYIGEDGVSAYGIIMYVGFIFAAVFIGYNICVSQVISYNFGAGDRGELRSLLKKSIVLISAAGIIVVALAETSAPLLSGMFFDQNESLKSLATHAIRVYMISFLLCGFNMFCSAWFTALNNGLVSASAAFVRTLVFELAAVFILPSLIGIDGIWYAVSVAEILAFLMSVTLVFAFRKRYL